MKEQAMDGATAFDRALALCDLGRWDDVVGQLATILATDPGNESALCLMAAAQLGQGAYDESLQTSLTAIAGNPENVSPHQMASLALTGLERHQEAQVMARNAVRLAPDNALCHQILGKALFFGSDSDLDKEDLDEARTAAEQAMFLAPDDADSHLAVGCVATAEERWADARAAFHRTLAIDPDSFFAHHELARLALTRGRFSNVSDLAEAAGELGSALRVDPRDGVSRSNVDMVLNLFLGRAAFWVFAVACVANGARSYSDAGLARLLPTLLLALPAFFVARFVFVLTPQLRGYLRQVLRQPFIVSAILCDAIAAAGLVVGAAAQRASSIASGCAVAISILGGLIMYHQMQSRATQQAKRIDLRYLWWLPPAILILITQAALGPRPAVVSWLDFLLRLAMPVGCIAVAYAIHRRRI